MEKHSEPAECKCMSFHPHYIVFGIHRVRRLDCCHDCLRISRNSAVSGTAPVTDTSAWRALSSLQWLAVPFLKNEAFFAFMYRADYNILLQKHKHAFHSVV
jgi:hypothetical protein